MIDEHHLSERRACRLVGLSRDSYRHPPRPDALTQGLADRIVQIAHVRRRFGYLYRGVAARPMAGTPAIVMTYLLHPRMLLNEPQERFIQRARRQSASTGSVR